MALADRGNAEALAALRAPCHDARMVGAPSSSHASRGLLHGLGLGLGALDAPRLGPGGNVPLDPAARERLKALGYVQ